MSLQTASTFYELHNLYCLYMSPKSAKSLLAHMAKIEKNRGVVGLFNVIEVQLKNLEALLAMSRSEAIALVRGGGGPLQGQWRHILYVALRRGAKGGWSVAYNLLDVRGHFVHPEPSKEVYITKKLDLESKIDPLIKDGYPTDESIDKIDELLAGDRLNWLTDRVAKKADYQFDMPYPFDTKQVLIAPDVKMPAYAVTPNDLVRSLWLFPAFTFNHYDFIKEHVIGERMPEKKLFSGFEPENDIGGSWVELTKDRRNKLRGVYPYTYVLQYICHPLHMYLKELLKAHPSSHIEDQSKGVTRAFEKLKAGIALSSVDIKSASDNTPLSAQVRLLQKTLKQTQIKGELIQMFEEACKMRLLSPYKGVFLQHKVGSPMGLKGSYNSFSWLLVFLFSQRIPLDSFGMVGDDIWYEAQYDDLVGSLFTDVGIPISEKKSIYNSKTRAEFCGRMITNNGLMATYKSDAIDYSNPMPSLLRYGKKVLSLIPGVSLADRRKLIMLPELERLHSRQSFLKVDLSTNFDIELGGYSPTQLFRMKTITVKQYYVMRYLMALIISKSQVTPLDFFSQKLKRKYMNSGVEVQYDIYVHEQVPLSPDLFVPHVDSGIIIIANLRDFYTYWLSMLQLDVEDEIKVKPGKNCWAEYTMQNVYSSIASAESRKGNLFNYKTDRMFYSAGQDKDTRARDHITAMARTLLSEKDKSSSPGSVVQLSEDMIDINPLESDIRKYDNLESELREVTSWVSGSLEAADPRPTWGYRLLRWFFRNKSP